MIVVLGYLRSFDPQREAGGRVVGGNMHIETPEND